MGKFNETSWPHPWKFYCGLDIEEITDLNSKYAIEIWKFANIKNLGDYRCLYIQSDTFLLAKRFENFRDNKLSSWSWTILYSSWISIDGNIKNDKM